jgi:hypothetical protein
MRRMRVEGYDPSQFVMGRQRSSQKKIASDVETASPAPT